MLDVFRRNANSWFAKVLMVLLGLSFVVWGIADVFRNNGKGVRGDLADQAFYILSGEVEIVETIEHRGLANRA